MALVVSQRNIPLLIRRPSHGASIVSVNSVSIRGRLGLAARATSTKVVGALVEAGSSKHRLDEGLKGRTRGGRNSHVHLDLRPDQDVGSNVGDVSSGHSGLHVLVKSVDTDDGRNDSQRSDRENEKQSSAFALVDLERHDGRKREDEDKNIGEDVECGHGIVDGDEVVAALGEGDGPGASDVLGTFKHVDEEHGNGVGGDETSESPDGPSVELLGRQAVVKAENRHFHGVKNHQVLKLVGVPKLQCWDDNFHVVGKTALYVR